MNKRLLIAGMVALALSLGTMHVRGGDPETKKVKKEVATKSEAKDDDDEKDEAKEKKSEVKSAKKSEAKEEDDEKDEAKEEGKEKKPAKAPQAVQDTVKKLLGKGKLLSLAPEGDGTYELDYKVNGVHQAAIIAADGKIQEEVTVEPSTLPKAVIEAVRKLYPKGKITVAEKSTTKDGTVYELQVSIVKSITVSPKGKVQ